MKGSRTQFRCRSLNMCVVMGVDLCLSPTKKRESLLPQNSGRILRLNDGTLFTEICLLLLLQLMMCNCWFFGREGKKREGGVLVLLYLNCPTTIKHENAFLGPAVKLPLLMDHEKFIEITPPDRKAGGGTIWQSNNSSHFGDYSTVPTVHG